MRTINRQPISVNQLDYDNVGYKFFNHSNWKGMCDDKNYLGVDQETFADCDNVYIDGEAVLRSRPSIKRDTITSKGSILNGDMIKTFGNYVLVKDDDEYRVYEYTGSYTLISDGKLITKEYQASVLVDQKIFIFCKNDIQYFDLVTKEWSIDYKMYIPTLTVRINGQENKLEEKNEFFSGYKKEYQWTAGSTFTINNFITDYITNGENTIETKVILNNGKGEYTGKLDGSSWRKFALPGEKLNANNFKDEFPWVIAKDNIIVISTNTFAIKYSLDGGTSFTDLPPISGCHNIPRLSEDKSMIYVVTDSGLQAFSILPNKIELEPTRQWINLTTYYNLKDTFFAPKTTQDDMCSAFMLSPDTFVYLTKHLVTENNNKYIVPIVVYKGEQRTKVSAESYSAGGWDDYDSYSICSIDTDGQLQIVISTPEANSYACGRFDYSETEGYNINTFTLLNVFEGSTNFAKFPFPKIFDIMYFALDNSTNRYKLVYLIVDTIYTHICIGDTVRIALTDSMINNSSRIYHISGTISEFYVSYLYNENEAKVASELFYITWPEIQPRYSVTKSYYTVDSEIHNSKNLLYGLDPINTVYINSYTLYNLSYLSSAKIVDEIGGSLTLPDNLNFMTELSNYFFAAGNKLYINKQGAKQDIHDFSWYFPDSNTQVFDYTISNLHPISTTDVAVFFENEIYYVTYDSNLGTYRYYKSRIPLGCKFGADVITTFDNKYTIFATKRGLVAMSYQDFINSTEQALTYLSDTIFDKFDKWNVSAIKLTQYKFWLICYRTESKEAFVFDYRNSSWWPMSYDMKPDYIVYMPDVIRGRFNGTLCKFDTSSTNYYDREITSDGKGVNIKWHIKSQKLHLNAINYYKHIVNLTFFAVSDNVNRIEMNLHVVNYRKKPEIGKNTNTAQNIDGISYDVDMIRTFVKRLNYYKLNEFEYTLSSRDHDMFIIEQYPLCLTNISIKYLVTGQVR